MYLAVFEINDKHHQTAKVWVDTHEAGLAQDKARDKLQQKNIEIITMTELIETVREDYFPPCTSLDTFEKAKQEGIAFLLS